MMAPPQRWVLEKPKKDVRRTDTCCFHTRDYMEGEKEQDTRMTASDQKERRRSCTDLPWPLTEGSVLASDDFGLGKQRRRPTLHWRIRVKSTRRVATSKIAREREREGKIDSCH